MTTPTDLIATAINESLAQYFNDLDGEPPSALYEMVLARMEKPLLVNVLQRVEGNQSRASEMLGINRNTLRKKLQAYDLL
ncbi:MULTISPECIES: helix-turn-helix domain-containing protein [Deefgea]|jgi:Fis family transcriptional regulator|uniref:Putative Fis-like DNA-binding protein n=2 Tax=Deefgea TaxID=400947 RepID=A0A8G1GYX3_9NEIS|nr:MULTISPECIES: helix-turn-helix domain-containing protein [Deefgea]MBM5574006.1 Fis family transcriptional regulator [Deefgea sp. CFH1-16]MCB5196584.1 Fis family transcriptional regulator [Deefgea salmonis]QKJ65989.1 Fis family transcriptional regulator [Deefgea piscis]QZA81079.1 Fis family transcriptional regulator [Deefgea piscis]QZA81124.1 Fis family transcriptional regulator [Deefgea piscis]